MQRIFGRTLFQLATITPNSVIGTFLLDNALDTSSLNYKTMKREYHKVLLISWLNVIAIPVYTNKKTVRKVKVTLNPCTEFF